METMDCRNWRTKVNECKARISLKFYDAKQWCKNNKDMVIIVTPVLIGTAGKIIQQAMRSKKVKKEEDLHDLYCYDRSLGHYWRLRRELTNDEWLEIDQRKKNGERLGDILEELKVLK